MEDLLNVSGSLLLLTECLLNSHSAFISFISLYSILGELFNTSFHFLKLYSVKDLLSLLSLDELISMCGYIIMPGSNPILFHTFVVLLSGYYFVLNLFQAL